MYLQCKVDQICEVRRNRINGYDYHGETDHFSAERGSPCYPLDANHPPGISCPTALVFRKYDCPCKSLENPKLRHRPREAVTKHRPFGDIPPIQCELPMIQLHD